MEVKMRKIKRILEATCFIQFFNATMDFLAWVLRGYLVPSWSLAVVMALNSVVILALLRETH